MRLPLARAAAASAVAWVTLVPLSGCSGAAATNPAVTPSRSAVPAPTYLCTPEAGGTPAPCDAERYTELERLTVLYAEAERAYRAFFSETSALYRRGGTTEAVPALAATAGGPYLKAQRKTFAKLAELESKVEGGSIKLVRVKRSPGAEARGYEIALDTCVDARTTEVVQSGSPVSRGIAYAEVVFFQREDGVLKAWDAVGEKVDRC